MSNNQTEDADNMGMAVADEDEMKSSDNDKDEGSPGTDRAGTDRAGSDRAGSDRAGMDRAGMDRAGMDRAGMDRAGSDRAGLDSDVDTYDNLNNNSEDTSAAQFRNGKDIQGIPWEILNITRETYKQKRFQEYRNYENVACSGDRSEKNCKVTEKGAMYYDFRHNSRSVKATILHFQLRNLLWATSKHDVYLMANQTITHWSSIMRKKSEVLNFTGHVAPCERHPGSLLEGFNKPHVSTFTVKDKLLIAGGFLGEIICKNLDRPGVAYCTRISHGDNAIINSIEIYNTPSGALHCTAANNDCFITDFDMERFQLYDHVQYPWSVNHTSMSPDGKYRVIVGDNPEALLVDACSGTSIQSLVGHLDYSFASAWNPDGYTFATGNQDKTCRIWDIRNLSVFSCS